MLHRAPPNAGPPRLEARERCPVRSPDHLSFRASPTTPIAGPLVPLRSDCGGFLSLCIVATAPAAAHHPTAARSEQPRRGKMDSLGNFHASVDRF